MQIIPIILFASAPPPLAADNNDMGTAYELAISFDLENRILHGTAHLSIPADQELTIFCHDIETTGVIIQNPHSPPAILTGNQRQQINIPAYKDQQEVFISYRKIVANDRENYIGTDGITLINNWHPQPSKDVHFSLSATLPHGFTAISEADHLLHSDSSPAAFSFSQPVSSLNFIAAPFFIDSIDVRKGLKVYTFFRDDDKALAQKYLTAAANHLRYFEKDIGPYPYHHFAIVENIQPTGYGMPTFTLLGSSVLRLPFIPDTSLGHEILHSWFGNGVRVQKGSGNWSEGLTTYLADWTYRQQKGDGAVNRKEHIIKYLSYITDEHAIPLQAFRSSSHNQPMADALRSVGYTKAAMLFHELKNRIGATVFDRGISLFYRQFFGKEASWQDIQGVFEAVSQQALELFFTERLRRSDIPALDVKDLSLGSSSGKYLLTFTLQQKTAAPYNLLVPISVETGRGRVRLQEELSDLQKTVRLELDAAPEALILDPDYDLLRELGTEETVPTWSQIMGTKDAAVFTSPTQKEKFLPFLQFLTARNITIVDGDTLRAGDLAKHDLIFLGIDNPFSRSLFALPNHPETGLTLDVRPHPLASDRNVLLVSCSNKLEIELAVRLLPHYGKYSFLHFLGGKNLDKKTTAAAMGLQYEIAPAPMAVASTAFMSFTDLIAGLSDTRAVYVGETHTSMADHDLQLRVIEAVFHQTPDLAIGLEMFPRSSQKALDAYIFAGESADEKAFLKQSRYFQVWKYDYRYYRDIINFAKRHAIQLVGLNIENGIVSSVFRNGSTESLSKEELNSLPLDRDLDMSGYRRRLSTIHGYHGQGQENGNSLAGFIQAQALWDETMAETVASYLQTHPQKRMVILAGAQHTRNDSGIPPRVQRRLAINQGSILTAGNTAHPSPILADYYIFPTERRLPPAGKIGVTLEETSTTDGTFLQITGLSPHSKAKEAGLLKEDILLSINGYTVKDMEDVRIAMIDARPGDALPILIERTDKSLQTQQMKITVMLYEATAED